MQEYIYWHTIDDQHREILVIYHIARGYILIGETFTVNNSWLHFLRGGMLGKFLGKL